MASSPEPSDVLRPTPPLDTGREGCIRTSFASLDLLRSRDPGVRATLAPDPTRLEEGERATSRGGGHPRR